MVLYDKYMEKLLAANDETVTFEEHKMRQAHLHSWTEGVYAARDDVFFNGDYYYIELIDSGEMEDRPMCCGEFLDWEEKTA